MDNIYTVDVHEASMSKALELARQGKGKVSPNPLCGCVLVKDGEVIGEGYHEKFGGPHAEIMAIRNSRQDPVDSTAYINLEPCCFTGKTPPCTDALIENGIKEVYLAMLDYNERVNGKGVAALENAGITVHVGILKEEAELLNRPFTKWVTIKLPWVIAKVAQSANGYMGKNSDSSIWLTGEESRKHTHQLRSSVDAILIGRQTAQVDDPQLTVRSVWGDNPKRVVVDTNRSLPLTLNIFRDEAAETIILCSDRMFEKNETSFCRYIPVREENGNLSPLHILQTLAQEGVTSLLIEGGYELLTSFINAELIDQVYIYTAPDELTDAKLKNPLKITEDWEVLEDHSLGHDHLVMAERKVECLQAL